MAATLQELFSLEGRVALVTGASGGIGRAIATGLASAGAMLAVNGRAVSRLEAVCEEIRAAHSTAAAFPADLSDRRAIPALVDAVLAEFGQIDILVNCAGGNRRMPIKDVTAEVYDAIMASNLDSIFFLSQAVLPHLVARGGGKIVNIGSLTSSIGLMNVSVYGITKSAVAQLTKTMAIEWAEHNIQVNCLCPGFIATELTAPLWADSQRSQWMLDRIPSKRAGRPEDLVGMAIYMASAASNYTTGQSIYVDGGFTVGSQW